MSYKSISQYLDAQHEKEDNPNPNEDLVDAINQQTECIEEQTDAVQKLVASSQSFDEIIEQANNRTYEYDENGNLVKAEYMKDDLLLARQYFEYGVQGTLLGEVWEYG